MTPGSRLSPTGSWSVLTLHWAVRGNISDGKIIWDENINSMTIAFS
jgi:hypothetical protein